MWPINAEQGDCFLRTHKVWQVDMACSPSSLCWGRQAEPAFHGTQSETPGLDPLSPRASSPAENTPFRTVIVRMECEGRGLSSSGARPVPSDLGPLCCQSRKHSHFSQILN